MPVASDTLFCLTSMTEERVDGKDRITAMKLLIFLVNFDGRVVSIIPYTHVCFTIFQSKATNPGFAYKEIF